MSIVWNNITDAEGGLDVRNKLNNVIAALVGFVNDPAAEDDQSRWEENGATGISPKDDKKPIMTSFEALSGAVDFLTVSDELKVTAHSGHTGIKPAGFNADGELVPFEDEEAPEFAGQSPLGRGTDIVDSQEHTVNLMRPHVIVVEGLNTNVYLPDSVNAGNADITLRKSSDTDNAVTLYATGAFDDIFFDGATATEITTTTFKSWVRLKCKGQRWYILTDSGNWILGA